LNLIPNSAPRLAKAAGAIGGGRTMTWIMPCSNDLNFDANRRFHIARFRPVAEILAEHGCALGLEFIGPKTLRGSQKYPFIHTMEAMVAMGAEIGPNVGLLLDVLRDAEGIATVRVADQLRLLGDVQDDVRLRALEQLEVAHVRQATGDGDRKGFSEEGGHRHSPC